MQHILRGLSIATDTQGDPEKLRLGQRIELAKGVTVFLAGPDQDTREMGAGGIRLGLGQGHAADTSALIRGDNSLRPS